MLQGLSRNQGAARFHRSGQTGRRPDPDASYAGTGLVVILITYFSIVLGELVPKRLGQTNPEEMARLVAKRSMSRADFSTLAISLLALGMLAGIAYFFTQIL